MAYKLKPIVDERFQTDLLVGILSAPIVFIPHFHYAYVHTVIRSIIEESSSSQFIDINPDSVVQFDLYRGVVSFIDSSQIEDIKLVRFLADILDDESEAIDDIKDKNVFVLDGVMSSIAEDKEALSLLTRFASLYERGYFDCRKTIILTEDFPPSRIPPQLIPYVKVIPIPFPDERVIECIIKQLPYSKSIAPQQKSLFRNKFINLFKGLHQFHIINILNTVLLKTGGFLSEVAYAMCENEKRDEIKKTDTLEVVDTDVSFDDIGGLNILKDDIRIKAKIFKNLSTALSNNVRLPFPKGVLILGMPGCGKSLIAKGIAHEFTIPLLRLDIGKLMGKYVGESEENLRNALMSAEASSPCVLWIDEVEKAFAGNNNGSNSDSLIIRLMGSFLTWMQERVRPVYIIATANDAMRPEFMRKGRFDEVYFVNFPNTEESIDILSKKIRKYQGADSIFDFQLIRQEQLSAIARQLQVENGGFAGAEIEALVTTVVEKAFVEYVDSGMNHKVLIKESDFTTIVSQMKPSIMANQIGKDGGKSNIDRIRDIQKIYKLKNASV